MTEIIDKIFDLSQTVNYILSIRFIPNGFCFVVFYQIENRIIAYKEITRQGATPIEVLFEEVSSNKLLQARYKSVFFLDEVSPYSLIPNGIFSDEDAEKIYTLNFGPQTENLCYHIDLLNMPDLSVVFAIPSEKENKLRKLFPTIKPVCRQSVQINTAFLSNKRRDVSHLFIYTYFDYFDAVLLSNGKLKLANTYKFLSDDEFLYYVISIYEHLDLDQYNIETILVGTITEKDSKMELLRRYIKNVSISNPVRFISGKSFENSNLKFLNSNLSNIPLCVL